MKRYIYKVVMEIAIDANNEEHTIENLANGIQWALYDNEYDYELVLAESKDEVMADERYDEMKVREYESRR